MLNLVEPWDVVADGYAQTTMKLFEGYADYALGLAELTPESKVLDVACGPGTLALKAAKQAASVDALDFSASMIRILANTVKSTDLSSISPQLGDGQNMPYQDNCFDVAFSLFGLMFFPDRKKGYAEIYRTLKPGGKVIISSWAPISSSPAMQTMFGAIRAMNPEVPEAQSDIESLENDAFFKEELQSAGFNSVKIHRVTEHFPIESIDVFWRDMVKGSAPIAMMKKTMSSVEWKVKEAIALEFLSQEIQTVPTSLASDAWIGYGMK